MSQNKRLRLNQEIIDYLQKYNYAIANQILKDLKILDARELFYSLNQLKKEGLVSIYEYFGYKQYILSGNKKFVQKKIKDLNNLIKNLIKESGPLSTKDLFNSLKKNFDYRGGIRIISQLARDLANQEQIFFKKKGLSRIYYDKTSKAQLFELKKLLKSTKNERIKSTLKYYYDEIISKKNLSFEQIKQLKQLWNEKDNLIFNFDCTGRSYLDLICVLYEFYLKKRIYSLIKSNAAFEDLKLWLALDHIITEINQNIFHRLKRKIYNSYVKEILNDSLFGEVKEKIEIFQTPNYLLKMRYLLSQFNFDDSINIKVLGYIQKAIENGYNVSGKSTKGILAGAVHIIYERKISQREIIEILNTNLVTLNKRKKELLRVNS